ncbi:MAG: type II toxin-antitoxin system RelE/ParE family toxin [bacterium]|nr:type II toxin-antitoxin system RelE/ParE family toxin [bacterium]
MAKRKLTPLKVFYQIIHHRLFEKEVVKIPAQHQQRIYRLLVSLKENPHRLPPNTLGLAGYQNIYRTRFGNFRLIYQIDHSRKKIYVLGVGSRGNVYKLLQKLMS